MARTITATYNSSSSRLTFSDYKVVPGDIVEIQGLAANQSGSLSWDPPGLFGTTVPNPSSVENGTKLTVATGVVGTYLLSLTVGSNTASGYLQISPGQYTLQYTFGVGPRPTLAVIPATAIVRAGDVLTVQGLASGDSATLSWSGDKSIFEDLPGNATSTTVQNGTALTVRRGVSDIYSLKLTPGLSLPADTSLFVNAIWVVYNWSDRLNFYPTPYVNRGDTVRLVGLPEGFHDGTLSWTGDAPLFAGKTSPYQLSGGLTLKVSTDAMASNRELRLSFQVDPQPHERDTRVGSGPRDTRMATGTLDPTGDGDGVQER